MAKALLKTGKTACDDLSNDEDPDCILEGILYGKFDDLRKRDSTTSTKQMPCQFSLSCSSKKL